MGGFKDGPDFIYPGAPSAVSLDFFSRSARRPARDASFDRCWTL